MPVEIDAEGGSIIFDFSNVTDADSDALVIQSDRNGLTVNFDDLEYSDTTFIKIDIRFANAK